MPIELPRDPGIARTFVRASTPVGKDNPTARVLWSGDQTSEFGVTYRNINILHHTDLKVSVDAEVDAMVLETSSDCCDRDQSVAKAFLKVG